MRRFLVLIVFVFIAAISVNEINAECDEEAHIYECHASDEEAVDLTCLECYPVGEEGQYNCTCWNHPPRLGPEEVVYLDCQDAYTRGENESGVYMINPDNLLPFKAYCDMETDGGGWTVIQRRIDGSVDFSDGWAEYIHGFGDVDREHWLGLSRIHRLANSNSRSWLRIDLKSFADQKRYAKYSTFYINGPSSDYSLYLAGYSGNAGDAMSHNNGRKFSAYDNDNDVTGTYHCAQYHNSGWWHASYCTYANLNGQYFTSPRSRINAIYWYQWLNYQSLKSTVMMIRPT